jgi:hypothetical protein
LDKKERLHCQKRKPRGHGIVINLYTYSKAPGLTTEHCKVTIIPIYRDPEWKDYNSAVIAYIEQNTARPKHREIDMKSPFDPVERAVGLLLPSFCDRKTCDIVGIAKLASDDFRVITKETLKLKDSVLVMSHYQAPNDDDCFRSVYVPELTEKSKEAKSDTRGQEITFTIPVSNADNIHVTKVEHLSSLKMTLFYTQTVYGGPGNRMLYARSLRLQGVYTVDRYKLGKNKDHFVLVFYRKD